MIFDGIDPSNTRSAATRLVDRVQTHMFDVPWSLSELGLQEADYVWLCQWAKQIKQPELGHWLSSYEPLTIGGRAYSTEALVGALLLLCASEAGRRKATEGQIWSAVRELYEESETYTLLFDFIGQPTPAHKYALERAARSLKLRHAFESSEKGWMVTVYLQFGFSRRSIGTRLAHWIAGYNEPVAIRQLAGPRGSHSFTKLWSVLADYRRGNITKELAHSELVNSPWIMPGDEINVLDAAARSREISDAAAVEVPGRLVSEPRLNWEGFGHPEFHADLQELARLDKRVQDLDIYVDGKRQFRLIRQPDGGWQNLQTVRLKASQPDARVSLRDPETGDSLAEEAVSLWTPEMEVEVFNLSHQGERVAPGRALTPGACYALAVPKDYDVSPDPEHWVLLGSRKLCLFASIPFETEVRDKSKMVWSAQQASPAAPGQDLRFSVFVDPVLMQQRSHFRLGDEITFRWLENGIDVQRLRANGVLAQIEGQSARIKLCPEIANRKIIFHAMVVERADGIEQRVQARLCPNEPISTYGLVFVGENGERIVSPNETIKFEDQPRLRPIFPAEAGAHFLFEAGIPRGKVRPRLGSIQEAGGGYGGNLTVRPRLFNVPQEENLLLCASLVRDLGIESFQVEAGTARLILRRPIEWDPARHKLLIWTLNKGLSTLIQPQSLTSDDGSVWTWSRSNDIPLAAGIAYNSSCVAAWYSPNLALLLADAMSIEDPEYVAQAIRWLGLPVLQDTIRRPLMETIRLHPFQFACGWILPQDKDTLLYTDNLNPHWNAAVNILFRAVEPWPDDVMQQLFDKSSIPVVADSLLRVSHRLFRKELVPRLKTRGDVEALILRYACAQSLQDVSAAMREPIEAVAQLWGVDTAFVTALAAALSRRGAPNMTRMNGDIAVASSEEFRRLFAIHCLRNQLIPG